MTDFGQRLARAMRAPFAALARRGRHGWALLRARRQSARTVARCPVRLLVVCYGNIYRSPFATLRLQELLAPMGGGFEIRSAGFHPVAGRQSPPSFVTVSRDYGVALETHRSRTIERTDVDWADAVVIMDRHNWGRLEAFGSAATDKVIWLGAYTDRGPVEIEDPYLLTAGRVREIVEQMCAATDGLASRLRAHSDRS